MEGGRRRAIAASRPGRRGGTPAPRTGWLPPTSNGPPGPDRRESPNGRSEPVNGGWAAGGGCIILLVTSFLPLLIQSTLRRKIGVWHPDEILAASVRIPVGLAVVFLVHRFVRRHPWPRPFRFRFVLLHAVAAPAFAGLWTVTSRLIEAVLSSGYLLDRLLGEQLFIGTIFYFIVAGIAYAAESTARAARAEAAAASTQLGALRAQLHPHFLFNALHTVVQLIPVDPGRAMEAAELVADLLRTSLEEQRDEVTLRDEWRFVDRYLTVERIRFGDRLVVREEIADDLLDARVPAFALQTLVENAVRHGAERRVAPTEIVVSAAASRSALTLAVRNTGDAGSTPASGNGTGTGLARLRERLAVLYGNTARLECRPGDAGGYEAVLVVPQRAGTAAGSAA